MIPLVAGMEILWKIEGINEKYGPVGWFFQSVITNFPEAVKRLLNGHRVGGDYGQCEFLRTNGGESFDSVKFVQFSPHGDMEVVISYEEFLQFLKMTATVYLEYHPDAAAQIK
ncbi:MAG TPA: ribonuclease toxin immunity protein CdiI, partial [Abditibacteriaceae bacterium]